MSILKLVGVGLLGAGCVASAFMYRESSSGSCCSLSGASKGCMVSADASSSFCDSGADSCGSCASGDTSCTAQCPSSLCPSSLCPSSLCPSSLCPSSLCPSSLCPSSGSGAPASEVSGGTTQTDIGDATTVLSDEVATQAQSFTIDLAPASEEK